MVMTVMILTQSVDYCQTHCVPGWPATSSSGSHCHPALLLPLLHLDVVYVHHHNNLCPVKFLFAVHNTVSLAWSNPNWFIKNVFKTAVKIFSHSHWEGLLFITVYQLNPNSSFMLQTPGKTILSSLSIIHGTHSSQQAPLASNIVALRVGYTASWVASWASNAINSCTMFASHNNFPASQSPSHPFPLTLQSVCRLPLSSLWVLQHWGPLSGEERPCQHLPCTNWFFSSPLHGWFWLTEILFWLVYLDVWYCVELSTGDVGQLFFDTFATDQPSYEKCQKGQRGCCLSSLGRVKVISVHSAFASVCHTHQLTTHKGGEVFLFQINKAEHNCGYIWHNHHPCHHHPYHNHHHNQVPLCGHPHLRSARQWLDVKEWDCKVIVIILMNGDIMIRIMIRIRFIIYL